MDGIYRPVSPGVARAFVDDLQYAGSLKAIWSEGGIRPRVHCHRVRLAGFLCAWPGLGIVLHPITHEDGDCMSETYANFDVNEFQRRIIQEFRENGGKVGGMFQDATLALLTTTGARTGEQRTVPLGYLEVHGKSVVVASAMGAPRNPGWYHNIRQDPAVTVELGTDTYRAMAAIPDGDEYEKLWAEVVEQAPGYGDYQARTTRRIPVVVLHRLGPEPGADMKAK
ncbi:nitroreductase family deazaflavin-dependent oxidoreductase [Actinoplanes sp. NPDC026619]|uniref:nitroreductase family deazaflavin-dependent oxidoreductase n=1 Tax=Actinoplanes sp. NPDC026619 TaxID=3155798 RepID=UPI0033FC0E53